MTKNTPHVLSTDPIHMCIMTVLEEKKANNIVVIPLPPHAIADHFIIASGQSQRQISALADHIVRALKQLDMTARVEGLGTCDWVLVDAGNIIVHLFHPEARIFYNLEKMWTEDDKDLSESPLSPTSSI